MGGEEGEVLIDWSNRRDLGLVPGELGWWLTMTVQLTFDY